jgi:hypothetical protein
MCTTANYLFNFFLNVSWLAPGMPVGLMPAMQKKAREDVARAEQQRVVAAEQW